MNFRKATDELLESVTLEDLAGTLKVSVQAVRQARAADDSTAHRPPPSGWEEGVKRLAERRIGHYSRLIERIDRAS
jgi:hypothetical protein